VCSRSVTDPPFTNDVSNAVRSARALAAKTIHIHSENNDFQHAEVLGRNREKRHKYREFFVEGVKSIELLLESGWPITDLIFAEAALSGWAQGVVSRSHAERHLVLPPALMQKLSDKEHPSEVVALARMPDDTLERIELDAPLLVVVADRPSSPGNLGTLIRTCDAFGANGLVITGHSVDVYDPKTIRASVGTLFALPVVRVASSKELEPWLRSLEREHGAHIVGTSARAERDVSEHDFTRPTVLVFGNETSGLSAHYRALCAAVTRIPIAGAASSLNVACAASIALYEVTRQRRAR
jgi:TrmH family RNA methyltransferase